jgi:energy-coupling factor transporter ATP-binding protein EcfA2
MLIIVNKPDRITRLGANEEAAMAIQLKNTADVSANGVKMLVYGQAGAGKTTLATTMPKPIIISAEGGLLSIQGANLPYIEVSSMETLREAYEYVAGPDGSDFGSVVLDSISEIGEVVLIHEKSINKDGRAAYGEMAAQMTSIIRAFRDLPGKHVLMIAKVEKAQDESGRMLYSPSMPGNRVGQSIPYFFDLVMALRVEKDAEGVSQRALMCDSDGLWLAKDRSGKLDAWEAPDLGAIIAKIGGAA